MIYDSHRPGVGEQRMNTIKDVQTKLFFDTHIKKLKGCQIWLEPEVKFRKFNPNI